MPTCFCIWEMGASLTTLPAFTRKKIFIGAGNCDWASVAKSEDVVILNDKRIFYTAICTVLKETPTGCWSGLWS